MHTIWKSRKFWIMVIDVVVSIATYFVTKYASPEAGKDVLFLIAALQPIILMVVKSMADQNVAGIANALALREPPR